QSFIMTKDDKTGDIMVMVVSKEITEQVQEQKAQRQALQDALMQAQHANNAKTTFLSNMSHDIRTPMNAIIGFTTIAVSHIDNKEQVKDCLQKVLSSSNHLLSLINDILDMSRIESGKVQIKEQECNISELMHNLVNIIQPQVKAKQLELFIDTFEVVNEDVIADALKMNQVFINLLSNAVKYTPAGGTITFRIMQKTTFRHGYGDYIFTIKDTGIGMSEEFVKHIFEPFERETTVTRSGIQGTGLGMAITKNIVEMMNGKITVESEMGKGSTFTVEFSLKLQDVEKNAEQIKELEGLRAMVVDDDFNICESVSKMLQQLGIRAEWTTSGKEAAYRAKTALEEGNSYHTYIIDWQMPEMSGLETTRKIRSLIGNDVPIIILTAYDWSDIEEDAKAAGVTGFCAKPLFMSDLKSALLAANNPTGRNEQAAAWTLADFGGKRVLLVEDIELNREIAEMILTEAGFVVESAPDGTDAVAMMEKAEENYYDVVLMDIQMPVMNGYEATRTIRNMPRNDVKDLPIIAMTANALEEDKEAALKNGMNAHIAKPLDMDVFISVLKQFVH
ncbi:MAG: response regulator, partial [Lachnospiraceae bacterium]|nr:response regulator [Lachnospiraceae bacterium]